MTGGPYEAVTAYPAGRSTPARFASAAAEMGFAGVIVRNARDASDDPTAAEVAQRYGIDVIGGIELDPDVPDDASGALPGLRSEYPLVVLVGGSTRINRFAATQRHVDVLARPITPTGPRLDPGTVATAVDNDVAIEVNLGPLREPGGSRVRYIQRLRSLWRVLSHHDAPYVVSMRPTSHRGLRGPRQVRALGEAVGIPAEAVDRGLRRWGELVADGPGEPDASAD